MLCVYRYRISLKPEQIRSDEHNCYDEEYCTFKCLFDQSGVSYSDVKLNRNLRGMSVVMFSFFPMLITL